MLRPEEVSILLLLVIGAAFLTRSRTRRLAWHQILVLGLLVAGGIAAFDGFRLAVREEWRQRYGATTTGVVVTKLATNPEARSGGGRAGRHLVPRTFDRADRAIARWIRTRSTEVWWVGFEYPSGGMQRQGGDTVSRDTWHALQPGQQVAVRFDPSRQDFDRAALDGQSDLPDALAQAAVGATLIGIAALLSRAARPKKARRRLSATALVTDVKALTRGQPRWQVAFAFLDDEGTKHECAQEFIRDIWQPGHEGLAEYEPDRPYEAVIIPVPALMARGPLPEAARAAALPATIDRGGTREAEEEEEPLRQRLVPALSWAGVWALVLAATGFIASIAGWTLYYPGSPQGPLHAIFIAAPGGAVAGAFLGAFIRIVRPRWSWAQVCLALAAAVAIYAVSLIDAWQRYGNG